MTARKRKKVERQRGRNSHGWGAKKKHRGAGHRGGRGMAGSGKRADQKKPTILKLYGNAYYGKRGFHRPQKMIEHITCMNVGELQKKLDFYVQHKIITKEKDVYVVDLATLGYQKLLGGGVLHAKLKVTADAVSSVAAKKVEEKGGVIVQEDVPS